MRKGKGHIAGSKTIVATQDLRHSAAQDLRHSVAQGLTLSARQRSPLVGSRLLVIALGAALLFSCRKELSIENASGLAGDFRAKINGAQWIAADTAKSAS